MKTITIIGYALSLLLLILTGWFYQKWINMNHQLTQMNSELFNLQIRAEADELFLQGMEKEAMALYGEYDLLTTDSLQKKRSGLIKSRTSADDSLQVAELRRRLDRTTTLLREYQKMEQAEDTTIIHEVVIDNSMELEMEIILLEEQLEEAIQEIEYLRNGRGFLTFSSSKNGSVTYFGDIHNGQANGKGFGYWTSGSTYDGYWLNNMRHGKGVFIWADGIKYEGDYLNDQRHGFGIYIAKAGKYEGQWRQDMRHGEGKLYEPNGKLKLQGVWENDKLVKTIK